ncbi:uncharacterized protein J4E88_008665 [Alternaria novae-zelandiae]|uniref:uncharacterized protein n=1 Tax=Alternaria novae-zelandiae TaxID=430562 RepID=UPI0020C39578|nr:uncharacterized protein J4E88_008665 [Alternaria novae-zelandiae]KAI4673609.1 hypothetical protein J4E88_008665 [Alternaria novae-zelandiae]
MTSNPNSRKRDSDQSEKLPDPKKLRRSMADRPGRLHKMITVIVGLDEEPFIVDKGTLLTSSDFFKKTLGTSLKNNGPEEVYLSDAEPRAFEIYLGWLETGYFYIMEKNDVKESEFGEILNDDECSKWDECYKLGHVIQDYDFQDACIDWLHEKIISDEHYIMTHVLETVYGIDDQVPAHRQLVVDVAAHLWTDKIFEEIEEDDYPPKYLMDILKQIGPKMRVAQVVEQDHEAFFQDVGCKYHAHVALNKPCYKNTHPAYK